MQMKGKNVFMTNTTNVDVKKGQDNNSSHHLLSIVTCILAYSWFLVCNTQFYFVSLSILPQMCFNFIGCLTKGLYNMIHFSHFQHIMKYSYKPVAIDTRGTFGFKNSAFGASALNIRL